MIKYNQTVTSTARYVPNGDLREPLLLCMSVLATSSHIILLNEEKYFTKRKMENVGL